MEFVKLIPINRICPCCGNGNYMRIISGKYVGELNVKCINCNSYYNYDELLKRNNSKPLDGADGRTMDDLISRAAMLEALGHFNDYVNGDPHFLNGIKTAKEITENLPAVDAVPVVHAQWVRVHGYCTPGGDPVWACSECGKGVHVYGIEHGTYGADIADGQWVSCPNCGAKMDGERRERE